MSFVRCFIAIEIPEPQKLELSEFENTLKARSPSVVKWVEPQGIHLTLKFLGEVPEEQVEEITMAMEEATTGIPPFQLEIKGTGAFPNLSRVQVVWVGITGETDKLAVLQKQVESNLEQLGFPRENRDFSAHLTLGRVHVEASPADRQKIGTLLAGMTLVASRPFQVDAIHLVKSHLTRTGAIYTSLKEIKLKS